MTEKTKSKRKLPRWLLGIGLVFAMLVGACGIYLGDYYPADGDAVEAFASAQNVPQITKEDGTIVFVPQAAERSAD